MPRVDLRTQVQKTLPRFFGGTDNKYGAATQWLLVNKQNDSGLTLTRGLLVQLAGGIYPTQDAGQSVSGVIVGVIDDNAELQETDCAHGDNCALAISGLVTIQTTGATTRGYYASASATDGKADTASTVTAGTFGQVIYPVDASHAVVLMGSGAVPSGSGSGADHGGLTGLADDDHSSYVTVIGGGGETISIVGATGSTETVDLDDGNLHDLTLDADCTLTLTGATAGTACSVTILLRQDGTGGWEATWPGSVVWPGGVTPTLATAPGSVDIFTLFTIDGGTVWYGFQAGIGSTIDEILDIPTAETDTTLVLSPDGAGGVEWRAETPSGVGPILISDTHSTPLIFDDLLQNDDMDDLLYADL